MSGATIDQVLYTADDENLVDVLDDAELIQAEGIFAARFIVGPTLERAQISTIRPHLEVPRMDALHGSTGLK